MNEKIERANELYKILPKEGKERVLNFIKALMMAEKEANKGTKSKGKIDEEAKSMRRIMYKGIVGVIKDGKVDGKFSGRLLVDGAFVFYGETEEEMLEDFKEAVEAYFEACEAMGIEPESVEMLDEKEV
ncbi:hypothetical protein [Aedoeadaptatus coli]|uniref:hypothetical protein n=1 Tax=Aedoeadaptatus coli TaxID=2058292 RepID=UPI000D55449C|nr:hypothetical protein [Peptoniphilus coli]